MPDDFHVHDAFPRVDANGGPVPVWNLTPGRGGCMVRFFDTPALSPSGRYAACFRLPFEDRLPAAGDAGEIVLIDLHAGPDAARVVATTRGWEPQLGAQVQWGATDDAIYFSDVEPGEWRPFTAAVNPRTGERRRIDGPLYHVSPDGRYAVGTNPRLMRRTQGGYGVVVPEAAVPERRGAPDDDGVWLTDAATGKATLLHSLASVFKQFEEELEVGELNDWRCFCFHSKFAPTGDRLLFTLRYFRTDYDGSAPMKDSEADLRFAICTCRRDGSDLAMPVPPRAWRHGGHHINFSPDGESLSMNLGGFGESLRFVRTPADREALEPILTDVRGSGHPSLHPDGRHLLTDCYWHEQQFNDDATGTTLLRWIDTITGEEQHLHCVENRPTTSINTLRIDPHPCWDRSWRFVTFTGLAGGTRRLFLADLRPVL